eukprot:sb/3477356/
MLTTFASLRNERSRAQNSNLTELRPRPEKDHWRWPDITSFFIIIYSELLPSSDMRYLGLQFHTSSFTRNVQLFTIPGFVNPSTFPKRSVPLSHVVVLTVTSVSEEISF